MPLIIAPINEELHIIKILIEDDKIRHHLNDIGITANASVRIVGVANGNLIVYVRESRLALNKEIARKIIVK